MIIVNIPLIEVQRHLQRKGYYSGLVDGNWNQETWAAIVEFKRANGLKPDGVVDATAWSILSS
jgi:peptidoglycan hydrolase-like protein with peptidoglycan-binding domain